MEGGRGDSNRSLPPNFISRCSRRSGRSSLSVSSSSWTLQLGRRSHSYLEELGFTHARALLSGSMRSHGAEYCFLPSLCERDGWEAMDLFTPRACQVGVAALVTPQGVRCAACIQQKWHRKQMRKAKRKYKKLLQRGGITKSPYTKNRLSSFISSVVKPSARPASVSMSASQFSDMLRGPCQKIYGLINKPILLIRILCLEIVVLQAMLYWALGHQIVPT